MLTPKTNVKSLSDNSLEIVSFSNRTRKDKRVLKEFVSFPWKHYRNDPNYIPLLDYEYLGFKLLGVRGFFESHSHFFKHAEMVFFLVYKGEEILGRCNAFVNYNHNKRWHDKVGFFGQFEAVNDPAVAKALLETAGKWLKSKGMDIMRGPQNMPINEATPGIMTAGFNSRPVIYYNYNKPYYEKLLLNEGFKPIKRVFSWEIPVRGPMSEKLARVAEKVLNRFDVTVETWDERPYEERKREMRQIYNDAWSDNFGFIPFTEEEFGSIIDDMSMIADRNLFRFLYVKGEPAAFIGAVPNIVEKLAPNPVFPRWELLRTIKMFLTKHWIKGVRLGYLGVKRKFRSLGLDGVMIWKLKMDYRNSKYDYCDLGWVLEDNIKTVRLAEMMGGVPSKTYTIFQKPL